MEYTDKIDIEIDKMVIYIVEQGRIRIWNNEDVDWINSVLVCASSVDKALEWVDKYDNGEIQPDNKTLSNGRTIKCGYIK